MVGKGRAQVGGAPGRGGLGLGCGAAGNGGNTMTQLRGFRNEEFRLVAVKYFKN